MPLGSRPSVGVLDYDSATRAIGARPARSILIRRFFLSISRRLAFNWSMFDFQLVVDSRPSVVSCQVIEYRLEGFRYANLSHLRIELPEISAECIAIHPLEQTPPYSVRMTFG